MAKNKQHFKIEASNEPLKFNVKDDKGIIIADVSLTSDTSFTITSFIEMSPDVLQIVREICQEKFF